MKKVKYHGGHTTIFLQKNVDVIIMDKTLQTKTSLLKQTYLTRSQQLMEKSIKKSGSSSVEAFAAKWKIPIIDHDDILCLCKKAMLQEELPVERRKNSRHHL